MPNSDDDDEMSQQLKDIFHPPVKAKQIDPAKIMKRRTRKKHSPRSAEYYKEGRAKTAKIYGKKKPNKVKRSNSAPPAAVGGRRRRKTRKNKRSKKRRVKKERPVKNVEKEDKNKM